MNNIIAHEYIDAVLCNVLSPEVWMLISIYVLFAYGTVKIASTDVYFIPKIHIFSIVILCCIAYTIYSFPESYNEIMNRNIIDSVIELFIFLIAIIIFVSTYSYNKSTGILSFEYYIIMLICICSFSIFIHTNDLILMYVLIELQSICSYILTAINKNNRYSIEAGIKYFILGSFSSISLLFGFTFIYGFSGLINTYDLAAYLRFVYSVDDAIFRQTMLFSIIFINLGLLFKIYAAPFHFWVSDIYQGSPTSVTMFIATIPVICYSYVFIKLYVTVFSGFVFFYKYVSYTLSITSISLGVLGALIQRKIKRLIAYSSVATIGYIIAGISGDSIMLVQQCIMYLFIYIMNVIPIFIILLNYRIKNKECIDDMRQLSSLYAQNPIIFSLLFVFLFSLAGVPPLAGFVSKLFPFTALAHEQMYIIIIICVLFTLIGCYNYIRIIKLIIYDNKQEMYNAYAKVDYIVVLILLLFVMLNISFIYIYPWMEIVFSYIAISLYS